MTERTDASRRDFLKLAGAAAPAAAAAAVVSAPDARADEQHKGEGLRKTAHTEAYLKSARF